jgi:Zn-dependent peptidase ImmA (M78 family)
MNTTAKGDKFEEQIYGLLCNLISQDKFLFKMDHCKLFRKKGYYSKDRGKDIIFDISIEVFLPAQDTFSLLFLVECKNYNHPVPVDDVEEFFSKIQQVSGANNKGIIAATNAFQEGTFNFSKSKGIGLLRYYDKSDFKWELTRSPSAMVSSEYATNKWTQARKALTIDTYRSRFFDCHGYSSGNYTNSIKLFFLNLAHENDEKEFKRRLAPVINEINETRRIVPYVDNSKIEDDAENVLQQIDYTNGKVSLNALCLFLSDKRGLNVQFVVADAEETRNYKIFGKIRFSPLQITVFQNDQLTEERERFTLAHELGHLIMDHSKYMAGEYCEARDFEFENPADLGLKDIMRMEWQANHFASCLLLPKNPFLTDFFSIVEDIKLKNRGFGVIYLDNQKINIANYRRVTSALMKKYKVSRTVVKIRLKKFGLLHDALDRKA